MTYGIEARCDTLREVLSGSIAAAYTAVGTALTQSARMIQIVNSTDKALYISVDGSTNIMRIAAGATQTLDFCTNKVEDDGFFVPVGTQFYVNRTEAGAPGSGSIAIQVVYAIPSP
jgi:hypothetical protein